LTMMVNPSLADIEAAKARRDEIVADIKACDERLEQLKAAMIAHPDAPLPEGTWTVRDALSHIAARANGVAMAVAVANNSLGANPADVGPTFDIDVVNRQQIADRATKDVDALLSETRAGHEAAIGQLASIDDQLLARRMKLPYFEDEVTVIDLIALAGAGHEQSHINDIARAVGADT
jgi:Mycothiol maleylpyruvate isomerase N-terminal domain